MNEITIITPEVADETEALDFGLVSLTEAIAMLDPERVAHGCLGGAFGYGADYENDVFMMHPYCWCDNVETCPWCYGCNCLWDESIKCPWCAGEHRFADKGALPPDEWPQQGAPNFWHKPSGLRVWWYKWIGRSQEVHNPNNADIGAVFRECVDSLPRKSM